MRKLKKNERNYLFYFKTLFFLCQSEKINLLKDIDDANKILMRSEQYKTIYTSNHISKNCRLLYIPKKNSAPVCFCFCSFVCFFYCAFMRKVLADFSYKPLALL